jgi:hypothetical protein
MSAADWIITIPMLILVLLPAFSSDDEGPLTPRRSVYRRHAWAKMRREEEREGVQDPRIPPAARGASRRTEPQAKWSDRR